MKLDKETFNKHRFWFMLSGMVPLVLVALVWLNTVVAKANRKDRLEVQKINLDLDEKSQQTKTDRELAALQEKEVNLVKQRQEVWKDAWEIQKDLIEWPKQMPAELNKLYFGDRLNPNEEKEIQLRELFKSKKSYHAQAVEVANLVKPVQFKGGLEKDGLPTKGGMPKPAEVGVDGKMNPPEQPVMQFVRTWKSGESGPPTHEECWLALEDLWVQRELFRAIHEANNSVGKLKMVVGEQEKNSLLEQLGKADFARLKLLVDEKEKAPAPKKGNQELHRARFRNPYWQLDLTVKGPENKATMRGTIKNVGTQRQRLKQITFQVWLSKDGLKTGKDAEELMIEGGFLGVGEEIPLQIRVEEKVGENLVRVLKAEKPVTLLTGMDGLLAVEQVLDGTSVPVKRIDRIALPYHSHRTYGHMKAPSFSQLREETQKPTGTSASGPVDRDAELKALQLNSSRTENGLERMRYLDRTEQVRRYPFGMVLIVDQAHVQDVLTAFANAKRPGSVLRIQPTQVDWYRYRGEFDPGTTEPPRKDKPAVGVPPPKETAAAVEQPFSLVELAYYGVASLYERYPPKTAPATTTEETAKEKP